MRITLWKMAGDIFLEGVVDSERLAYRCIKGEYGTRYILGGSGGFRECPRPSLI